MSRRQDVSIIDERAAAELSSGVEKRGDPWPFARISGFATHNALLILIAVLRAALRQVEARASDGGRLAGGRYGGHGRPPGRLLRRPRGAWFLRARGARLRGDGGGGGGSGEARRQTRRGWVSRQTKRGWVSR